MLAVEKGLGISFISRLAVADRLAQGRLVALTPSRRFPAGSPSPGTNRSSTPAALRRFLTFCRAQTLPLSRAEAQRGAWAPLSFSWDDGA